ERARYLRAVIRFDAQIVFVPPVRAGVERLIRPHAKRHDDALVARIHRELDDAAVFQEHAEGDVVGVADLDAGLIVIDVGAGVRVELPDAEPARPLGPRPD